MRSLIRPQPLLFSFMVAPATEKLDKLLLAARAWMVDPTTSVDWIADLDMVVLQLNNDEHECVFYSGKPARTEEFVERIKASAHARGETPVECPTKEDFEARIGLHDWDFIDE